MENADSVLGLKEEGIARRRRLRLRVINSLGAVLSYLLAYPPCAFLMYSVIEADWLAITLIYGGLPCLWLASVLPPYNEFIGWFASLVGLGGWF